MFAEGIYRELGAKLLKRMSNHEDLGVDYIHLIGSRSCGKTQFDIELNIRACNVYDKLGRPIRVDSYATRYGASDVEELWDDWNGKLEDLPELYIPEKDRKRSRKTWDFENGNKLKFKHINSQYKNKTSNTGLATSRAEYIIANVEEAYEVPPKKMQDFMDAVRGKQNAKTLVINVCNPWDAKNDYIAWLLQNCPFDEQKMRTQGYHWKFFVETNEEGYQTRHLIIWINWRSIKKYLSEQSIARILRRYVTDPTRAKTADLGCPAIIDTAVYANFMQHVGSPVPWIPHSYYVGGGDIGIGVSSRSGITAFVFGGLDPDGLIDVYREFVWDNHKECIDSFSLANAVVKFYMECREEFYNKTGIDIASREMLKVSVDNSSKEMCDILNAEASRLGQDNWIYFVTCKKYAIIDRIHATTYVMGQGRLRIDEQCKNLWKEFHLSMWEEKQTTVKKRVNDNDHSINAFEYAFEDYMREWVDSEHYEEYKRSGEYNKRKRLFI